MTTADHARLPTRQLLQPDLPAFDAATLDQRTRDALAELLLSMADDEFICGFWDSEWTGIAPLLEEDVAFSSLAQDEIGHARLLYEMVGRLTGEDADRLAFHRPPEAYHHARLLDHPHTDWAFSIARAGCTTPPTPCAWPPWRARASGRWRRWWPRSGARSATT